MKLQRLIIILAVLLVLPLSINAQPPVDGVDFGMIVSSDAKPAFGYAISNTFDVTPVGGPLFEFIKAGVLYSDRGWFGAQETYVARAFTGREVHYGMGYASVGGGTWAFLVSDGSDHAKFALCASIGIRAGPLDCHLGGEVVSFDGPDLYYLSAGLVIIGL